MSETKLVTILTPTYNRRCELERLYNSLCIQSKKDFVWFVVDDGSTDETCTFVNNLSSSDFETHPRKIVVAGQIRNLDN